jgi:hypothetical protein
MTKKKKETPKLSAMEKRLLEVEAKRQEIIAEGERGRGLFTTWYSLPNDPGYSCENANPLHHLLFTASLSRKHDDTFYLYRLQTYDGEAYDTALEQASSELGCSWHDDEVNKRAVELLKEGVEITPFFSLNDRRRKKDGSALIEVIGVVDVYSFDSDGIAKAINMFLDGGEVEYEGEPLVHRPSEGFLQMLEAELREEWPGQMSYCKNCPQRLLDEANEEKDEMNARGNAMVEVIISGGQTGADRAALDFALERGFEIQGFCPRDRRAEDGPLNAKYPLQETKSRSYQKRTGLNVELGDATVIFNGFLFNGLPEYSPGTETAIRFANKCEKPFIVLQGFPDVAKDAADLKKWLTEHKPKRLNIAGNGEEKCPGMYAHVLDVLRLALREKVEIT